MARRCRSCCSCPTTVVVRDACTLAVLSGALVSWSSAGDPGPYTCTTDGTGSCTANLPGSGTWTRTVSKSGYTTSTSSVTVTCGGSATVDLTANRRDVAMTALACGGAVDATLVVTVKQGATVVASGTVDGSGHFTATNLTVGTAYTLSAADPGGRVASTGGVTPTACPASLPQAVTLTFAPATGYHCIVGCSLPIADTLTLVDSAHGTCTLSYSGSVSPCTGPAGLAGWFGFQTVGGVNYLYFLAAGGIVGSLNELVVWVTGGSCEDTTTSSKVCPASAVLLSYAIRTGSVNFPAGTTFQIHE